MTRRRMLFVRDFQMYSGGHGKVFDWFRHVGSHPGWSSALWLTPRSRRGVGNPWVDAGIEPLSGERCPVECFDALFLAGMDWEWVQPLPGQPVINLIQSLRHADALDPRFPYLRNPALRIAVSREIARLVTKVGCSPPQVEVVPAAIDVSALRAQALRARQVPGLPNAFVDGTKDVALGQAVANLLERNGVPCTCIVTPIPRHTYLGRLARATVAILLPAAREGFYLPAMEAMAMGVPVVTCDAGGNREYLRPGVNALVVAREATAMADAATNLIGDVRKRGSLVAAGARIAMQFDLPCEQRLAHAVLDRVPHYLDTFPPCPKSTTSH